MDSTSKKVVQENRDYTMFSWSVQGASAPLHMKRGQGVFFWDGDDNKWLDFSSQLINLNVGHQHPKMLEAIKKQVDELCFAGPGFATEPRGQLGKKLAEVTGLAKAFFTLGGSEANENAMKMARLFTGRDKIITRYRSYHGATMGSMTASGDPRRWAVEPGIPGIVRVFDPVLLPLPVRPKSGNLPSRVRFPHRRSHPDGRPAYHRRHHVRRHHRLQRPARSCPTITIQSCAHSATSTAS